MAVPKKKKSSSISVMSRGSNGTFKADFTNVIVDSESGEFKLPHHVINDTYKNGKLQINLRKRAKQQKSDAEQLQKAEENETLKTQSE